MYMVMYPIGLLLFLWIKSVSRSHYQKLHCHRSHFMSIHDPWSMESRGLMKSLYLWIDWYKCILVPVYLLSTDAPQTDFNIHDYKCRDHNSYCPYWGRVGECRRQGQVQWMRENCPHTCGACHRDPMPRHHNSPYDGTILPITRKNRQ